ncbi:histidine phosphatase family protein [[Clostridium] spiroforme]|nr:histidine phosphatase family protein [Thomasclavelia spiroformis]MBM6879797.1 histidine phosphatase family protein [Thomasclavelia spiroformis]
MKIYITRHSLTKWNEEKRLQGWKDSPLTLQGETDAKKLGVYMKQFHIDRIYSSPIERAYQTAIKAFPDDHVIKDDRLKEMNFGDYEGLLISDLRNRQDYHDLWYHPQAQSCLPGGETYQHIIERLNSFFKEKYEEDAQQSIFITIHGMLFTILHGMMLDLPVERFNEVNQEIVRGCSLSLVEYDGQSFDIIYIGNDEFLDPMNNKIVYK